MLLSMESLLMVVCPNTHVVDLNVGEMFNNFRLYSVMEHYCGVDLGSYLGHKKDWKETPLWMRWVRLITGLVLSPCAAIQVLL